MIGMRFCRELMIGAALAALSSITAATAQAASECGGFLPTEAHLPDLIKMIPIHVHVQESQKTDQLLFTTGIANVGEGPMELEPTASLTDPSIFVDAHQNIYDAATAAEGDLLCWRSMGGAFLFHPAHNHWHLAGVNGYEVRAALDDGRGADWSPAAIGAEKESFCLVDTTKMSDEQLDDFGITLPTREYWDCFGVHGISTGWMDYYHHSTHEQYVDITGAAEGIYYLILTANPNRTFIEADYTNNRAWVSFSLRYNNKNNAIVEIIYDSLQQAGEGLAPPSKNNR